jgi:hypothetical protein
VLGQGSGLANETSLPNGPRNIFDAHVLTKRSPWGRVAFVLEGSRDLALGDLGGVLASVTAIFRRYPEGANRARDSVKPGS